jgi:hypothetical protein
MIRIFLVVAAMALTFASPAFARTFCHGPDSKLYEFLVEAKRMAAYAQEVPSHGGGWVERLEARTAAELYKAVMAAIDVPACAANVEGAPKQPMSPEERAEFLRTLKVKLVPAGN